MRGVPMVIGEPIMIENKIVGRTRKFSFHILKGKHLTEKEVDGLLCEAEIRDTLGISEEKIFIFENIKSIHQPMLAG